jgi:RNA polymerase sigma-70 factor (ECF subfamily)
MVEMAADDRALRGLPHLTTTNLNVDWDAVFKQELPRIYNYLRYRLGDNALAEDLTAATFEKAWRARERYRRNLAGFSTWLITIARNTATDHLRQYHPVVSLQAIHRVAAPDSPEGIVARQLELDRLAALLAALPERDRELVALKYGAQLNNREIARHTGMSESNVGTSLHRIVGKLRSEWDE